METNNSNTKDEEKMNRTEFETNHLIIRHFTSEDWQDLLAIARSKESSPYAYADFPWPTTEKWAHEAANYMAGIETIWAMVEKETSRVICFVNFNGMNDEKVLDIGHVMNMDFGHRGYETEGLGVLYAYAFDTLGATAITASWAKDDRDKLEQLENIGMKIVSEKESEALDGSGRKFTGCMLRIEREEFNC